MRTGHLPSQCLALCLACVVCCVPLRGEDVVIVQEFRPQDVMVVPVGGQHTVTLADGVLDAVAPGLPNLPARTINVAIPRGARGLGVRVTLDEQLIGQDIMVRPCQPQTPPGQPIVEVAPDPQAYALDASAPVAPAVITGTHNMRGRSYVTLQLFPVRYNAALPMPWRSTARPWR